MVDSFLSITFCALHNPVGTPGSVDVWVVRCLEFKSVEVYHGELQEALMAAMRKAQAMLAACIQEGLDLTEEGMRLEDWRLFQARGAPLLMTIPFVKPEAPVDAFAKTAEAPVPSGIAQLDEALKGNKKGELWIHAGHTSRRTSQGAKEIKYPTVNTERDSTLPSSLGEETEEEGNDVQFGTSRFMAIHTEGLQLPRDTAKRTCDATDLFEQLFMLYQRKDHLPVSYIYEALNIDPKEAMENLRKDALALQNASMNKVLRTSLLEAEQKLSDCAPDFLSTPSHDNEPEWDYYRFFYPQVTEDVVPEGVDYGRMCELMAAIRPKGAPISQIRAELQELKQRLRERKAELEDEDEA